MKQELPIASVLLAVGALLWFASSDLFPSSASGSEKAAENAAILPQERQELPKSPSKNADRKATAPQAAASENKLPARALPKPADQWMQAELDSGVATSHPFDHVQLDSPDKTASSDQAMAAGPFWHPASDPRAVEFLVHVATNTAASPPLGTAMQIKAKLFGQPINASGRYFQAGQGSHKSRLELVFGSGVDAPSVFQMCDGRFVYRLENFRRQQSFNFVDLKRIQDHAGESPSSFSPTGWVATGELSSMLQHLGSAFNFGSPNELTNGDIVVRGSWSETALRQVLAKQISGPLKDKLFNNHRNPTGRASIHWQHVPPQLPHGVELVFTKSSIVEYFPKQITFVRFEEDKETKSTLATPVIHVSFSMPQRINEVNDRMFVIDSKNTESTDVTDNYLTRVNDFMKNRVADGTLTHRAPIRQHGVDR